MTPNEAECDDSELGEDNYESEYEPDPYEDGYEETT